MNYRISAPSFYFQRGFNLLELLVGIMVGMLVIYGSVKIYAVSDDRNRTVGAKNDTQATVALVAHMLEQDIRLGGRGFSHFESDPVLGCEMTVHNSNASPTSAQFKLFPVYIVDGENGAPDEIHVFYGNSPVRVIPDTVVDGDNNTKLVGNKGGFLTGDKVLLTREDTNAKKCAIMEITERLDDEDTEGSILKHDAGISYQSEYESDLGKLRTASMNADAGTVESFTGGHAFSLGPAPVFHRWYIDSSPWLDSRLMRQNRMPHSQEEQKNTEVGVNIVDLQAQYGYFVEGCENFQWVEPSQLNDDPESYQWENMVAVRFALLIRDPHYRKEPYVAQNPVWSGGEFVMPGQGGAAWHRYGYEVQEVVVPLRNYLKQWRKEGKRGEKC